MKKLIFIIFITMLLIALPGCPPGDEGPPPSIVVSGADAVTDEVDGTYTLMEDEFNSKPQYQSSPIGLSIFFGNSNVWLLYYSIEQMTIYQHTDQDDYPPETGWSRATGAGVDATFTPHWD